VVALVGPSGCGKTSLLRAVAGLAPTSRQRARERRRPEGAAHAPARVGVVFQDHALFPHLDVAGNVAFGLVEARVPAAERRARVRVWLDRIGLASRLGDRVDALSGGERQRVALARALAPEPALVLLDEPFASLDPGLRSRLSREVAELLRASGPRRSSSPTTSTRPSRWAIGWGCCGRGGSCRWRRRRRLIDAPIDPWTARFLGHANVWTGAATARLPGRRGRPVARGPGALVAGADRRLDPGAGRRRRAPSRWVAARRSTCRRGASPSGGRRRRASSRAAARPPSGAGVT
jgi:ABC-type Fe3+/spermidine/putrescine transport system ATPase subunit